jgi:hypothetical protein
VTDADSIRESKLSRLQDPNPEKMKPLVGLMGELRERRQERGEPRPGPQALRRARGAGPGGGGYSVDDYILTPIVPCSVCDARYVEDPTRDGMGRQLPEENLVERLATPLRVVPAAGIR